jgi:hypothetical protein
VYKATSEEGKGTCYSYDVLSSICIEVGLALDVDRVEEQWEFRGGCYKNDSPAKYERGVSGQSYTFDSIPIEVRASDDPYTVISKHADFEKTSEDYSFFSWLSQVSFGLFLTGSLVSICSCIVLKRRA